MKPMKKRQWDILDALDKLWAAGNHSASRKEIGAVSGFEKGYSRALGPRTRGPVSANTLEGRGYVECTNPKATKNLEYRITDAGRRALESRMAAPH